MDVRALMGKVEDMRSDGNLCVITSESVIRGRFSDGLTIGVIPMHLVTRGGFMSGRRSLITPDVFAAIDDRSSLFMNGPG